MNSKSHSSSRMTLAVPSKGRLKEQAEAYFAKAGLALTANGGTRAYTGIMAGLDDVDVLFLPAQEIATRLAEGSIDIGVTGLDLLDEQDSLSRGQVYVLQAMNFGRADVLVAVPDAWIDVANMDDLDDVAALFRQSHGHRMRVATKYISLTRRFFTAHGVGDYKIVESPGATEAAPAVGAAELIVDISSTGETLKANRLKTLQDGIILRSEAVLAARLSKPWDDLHLERLGHILGRIGAEASAKSRKVIEARSGARNIDLQALTDEIANIDILEDADGVLRAIVPADAALTIAELLQDHSDTTVMVSDVNYLYGTAETPLAGFEEALAKSK